jgi:hypothetical protein
LLPYFGGTFGRCASLINSPMLLALAMPLRRRTIFVTCTKRNKALQLVHYWWLLGPIAVALPQPRGFCTKPAVLPLKKPTNLDRLIGFSFGCAVYIVPVLLDVVDVFVFFIPLWLCILALPPVLPFIEPVFLLTSALGSTVPSGIMPLPRCGCVLTLPLMEPVVLLLAGVVWAKAAVLRKEAQAAATRI